MTDISSAKREARAHFRAKRAGLSPEKRSELDAELCRRVINCEAYRLADVILAYYPIKNEPDILPIVKDSLGKGKRVAFPVSNTESFELDFRFIRSLDDMIEGAYSIPEPRHDAERFCVGAVKNTLCIVPGLSFDRKGFRIGYGKGFYDRFLSKFDGVSLGLLYDGFLCEILPKEDTDLSVDFIITEKEEIFTHVKKE